MAAMLSWLKPFVILALTIGMTVLYFLIKFEAQAENQLQVPFIREALAEHEAKKKTSG
jgi:hypothetical protein